MADEPSAARARQEAIEQRLRARAPAGAIPPRSKRDTAPLSPGQESLLFLQELFPDSIAYNIPSAYLIRGPLQVECLRRALHEVALRHPVLRSTLDKNDSGEPMAVVGDPGAVELTVHEVAGEAEARSLARALARAPFDLRRGPLLRVDLLRSSPHDHVLLICFHHIVADHWSLGIVSSELSAAYARQLAGTAPAAGSPLALDYGDFAAWQRSELAGGALARRLTYWRGRLAELPPLELPGDRPRPPVQSFEGERVRVRLPAEPAAALARQARQHEATQFMALTAGLAAVLARCTGQEDLALGAVVAGRSRPELEGLVGYFANTVVLRLDLTGDPDVPELFRRVRASTLEAYAHQDVPFGWLVRQLAPERDLSRMPLVTVGLSFLNVPAAALDLPGTTVTEFALDPGVVKFELDIAVTETPRGIVIDIDFRRDVFDRDTISRFGDRLVRVLAAIAHDARLRLSELPLISDDERAVLATWSQGPVRARPVADDGRELPVHELVARRAAADPAALALVEGSRQTSYGELVARAAGVTELLRSAGVGRGSVVATCAPRSTELAVMQLAILGAGAAYLPLDPSGPRARVAFQLADAGVTTVLAVRGVGAALPAGVRIIEVDAGAGWVAPGAPVVEPDGPSRPDDLAYVIFTSGSTGEPKGVEITHAGLTNLVCWHVDYFQVTTADRGSWLTSIDFDAAVWELWPYLAGGASVAIGADEVRREVTGLPVWLREQQVTICWLAAPVVEALLRAGTPDLGRVRAMLTGADRVLSRPPAGAPFRLYNAYGPTESTVVATAGEIEAASGDGRLPSIGTPLDNLSAHVIDRWGNPAPVGVTGELHVGGVGLARGYLNRPELTQQRFVANRFGPGRLYRTGDLARWRGDGTLDFAGRVDQQVKVNGYRVELAEVELALAGQAGVAEAVVVADSSSGQGARLVGYVVPVAAPPPEPATLRAALRTTLPEFMVPASVVLLEAMPLTSQGKIDRGALPAASQPDESGYAEAAGEAEQIVAKVWAELLGVDRVGRTDNFFERGGHSVMAMHAVARLRREHGVEVSVRTLFDHPVLADFAANLPRAAR